MESQTCLIHTKQPSGKLLQMTEQDGSESGIVKAEGREVKIEDI